MDGFRILRCFSDWFDSGTFQLILHIYMSSSDEIRKLSTLVLRQRKARLFQQLRQACPPLIRGSLAERFLTCGRPKCSCHQGSKHGPFYYLNRCLPKGRMSSLLLKSPEQVAQARQAVAAFASVADILDQLSWINLELLRRKEQLNPQDAP